MNIWRAKRDARELYHVPYLIYVAADGWLVAGWNGSHFICEQTTYTMDDVDAIFELPRGTSCSYCHIPTDVIRRKKNNRQIFLRCPQCGRFIEEDYASTH